jgi:hypothetical protein
MRAWESEMRGEAVWKSCPALIAKRQLEKFSERTLRLVDDEADLPATDSENNPTTPAPQPTLHVVPKLNTQALEAYDGLRQFMLGEFPILWPAMDSCVCACMTLLFRHLPAPIAVGLLGAPGSGKGTVLEMFSSYHHRVNPIRS